VGRAHSGTGGLMVFTRPHSPQILAQPDILPLYHGDCEQILATLPENTFDAVVTDPPYGIRFMGRAWDGADIEARVQERRSGKSVRSDSKAGATGGHASAAAEAGKYDQSLSANQAFQEWVTMWARALLRVLKPGGHLLAFGSPRIHHRLFSGVEDAGFEIRDTLMWVFSQGFPKSMNVGDGWGTALKPAHEPIVLARKRCSEGTVAANILRWGTGALNIESSRVGTEERINAAASTSSLQRGSRAELGHRPDDGVGPGSPERQVTGRWPANIIHDGSDEVLAAFPDAPGQLADASETAPSSKTGNIYGRMARGGAAASNRGKRDEVDKSAARFFYCAKAKAEDRCGSKHPTIKPVALIRYLVKLITPPGGRVLDAFAGSGTMYEAAITEGFRPTLIEREREYIIDIQRRMERCVQRLTAHG
jgi:DNA modification methylase